jgi:hypothetical protein
MTSPPDPFSAFFDSVEFDPSTKPTPEAIERAIAFCGPPLQGAETPGFYLIDDAGGRFVVDPLMGVISLRDDAILERERGAIHVARLMVVEQSGERYELDLKLRLSGRVPQLVSEEDALSDTSAAVEHDDEDVISVPRIHWTRYVAVAGLYTPASLAESDAPYGAMLSVHLPGVVAGFAGLTLVEDLPPPAARDAIWTP